MKQPFGKSVSFAEKYKKLLNVVDTKDILAILVHADPDALASAMALKRLFWRCARRIDIFRVNKIARLDNRTFIRLLNVQQRHIRELKKSEVTKWALVDAQPLHHEAFAGYPFDIVIDHHPVTNGWDAAFIDIKPDYGANATIMAAYLKAAGIKPSAQLATALFYAIKSDTDDFVRGSVSRDIIVFRYLYELANLNIVKKIEASELSVKTLDSLKKAMENLSFIGETAFVHLGQVSNADTLVIVADFFMKLAEATWSVVSGIQDGRLIVIFRNAGFRHSAGKRARETFGDIGTAGGHQSAARAEMPLEKIDADAASPPDFGEFVLQRLKKAGRYAS